MITKLGPANSFCVFGKNGMMERNQRVHISKGTKVFAFGANMCESAYVVYDDNMNAVEIADTEEVSEYELERYFSPKHHLDETTRPISEKFGIGFYYDESNEIISDEVIEKSLRRAENLKRLGEEVKARKEKEYSEEKETLSKEYDFLERAVSPYDHNVVGRNLRTELKRNFPSVKFSVKKDGYNSYCINWTDGPTENQVRDIYLKYKTGRFDSYTDYAYSESSPFTDLFGGVDYIFTSRIASDYVKETYPDWYDIDFTPKVEDKPKTDVISEVEVIEDYSEKSFLVKGNTYAIKDELQKIGCIWLRKEQAWCFSKKRREEVRKLIGC